MPLDWSVGPHESPDAQPELFVPAEVPGAVQLDWARHHGWDPHTYDENWQQYTGLEDRLWTYRAAFSRPALDADQRLRFRCLGIDYAFTVRCNGVVLLEQEGMFTPVDVDVTDTLRDRNELTVTVHPAPKLAGEPETKLEARQSCKPAVSYGWDWHPRLIPLGIWDDAELVVVHRAAFVETRCTYTLNDRLDRADLSFHAALADEPPHGKVTWRIDDPAGQAVLNVSALVRDGSASTTATLERPALWWPHDHGEQPLYLVTATLEDAGGQTIDRRESRVGFRRVRLVQHPGAWDEPADVLKPRTDPPITLEVNGRRVFAKGTNWVPPEIFPGTITAERYDGLLRLAKQTNFNLLRIWGGGITNKRSFHEKCDELGLMVWNEFPLACNDYFDSPAYLETLDQESRSIVTRLREHPSTVMWCGGNELFNAWSGMTDQSKALRQSNAVCLELDPDVPFIATSPLAGWSHGFYLFRHPETGEEVFEWMRRNAFTAYTEFGVPSASPVEVLHGFLPEGDRFPPRPDSAWTSHHAFNAWHFGDESWLALKSIRHYFGEPESLEQLVAWTQWLQAEGYRFIYEEARRQKPKCSMALNWCFNDCWPCAANNSLVAYPAVPKPALAAVRDACRPTLASARVPRFAWKPGEQIGVELFVLNDAPTATPAAAVTAELRAGDQKLSLGQWDAPPCEPNTNQLGPTLEAVVPAEFVGQGDTLELILTSSTSAVGNNAYRLRLFSVDR